MARSTLAHAHNRTIDLDRRAASQAFVLLGTAQVTLIAAITVTTVALPVIARDLRLDESGLVLVSAAYGISFGGLLTLGGRLADRFGSRLIFAAGTIVFGLGSIGAGLAPSPSLLVAARLAAGAGAALAAPAAVALLGAVYPDPDRHGRALAIWGVLSSAGAIAGTVASGVLITWVPWRWVLAAPAAIAAVTAAGTPRLLPAGPAPVTGRIDWPGAVLATAGLAALSYGLQRPGWAIAAGVVLLSALVLAERRSAAPLVPLWFLRRRVLPLAAVLLCAAAMAAAFFLLSLYLQQVRGLSPLQTSGIFLLPVPAAVTAGPLAGRLIRRFGARRVLAAGLLTAAAGLLLLSVLAVPYPGLLVFPFGAGLAFSASLVITMQGAGTAPAGLAAALVSTAMETGPPLGLATLTRAATAYSHDPAAGDPFALRTA
ncbi:MAG: MFS transporter, partial [Nocardiopsaceae bacterium]|nr:MFS transporter [Nocardiopsaceae bacterium]